MQREARQRRPKQALGSTRGRSSDEEGQEETPRWPRSPRRRMSSADRADSASVSASPSAESPRDEEGFSTQQRYALDLQRQIIEQSHRRDRERRAFRDRSAPEEKGPWREEEDDASRRRKQQHADALRAQVEEKR